MAKHITPPALVVARFGSRKATARAINKHCGKTLMRPVAHTTVGRWVRSGHIPGRWGPMILHAARAEGLDINPEDLIYGRASA